MAMVTGEFETSYMSFVAENLGQRVQDDSAHLSAELYLGKGDWLSWSLCNRGVEIFLSSYWQSSKLLGLGGANAYRCGTKIRMY